MSTSQLNSWSSKNNSSFDEEKWGTPQNKNTGPVAPTTEDFTDPMDNNEGGQAGNNNNNEEGNNDGGQGNKDRGSNGTRMAGSDGFRNALERNLGTEEYERIGAEGLDAANDRGQYSAAEVKSEFRNSDKSVDEMTEYYQGLADNGTKFNKRAQDFLTAKGVQLKANGGGGGGGGSEEDDGGDSGDGGNGGDGGGGTKQAGYKPVGPSGVRNAVNLEALQTRIHERPLYMQAQADLTHANIFGDTWSWNSSPSWNSGRDNDDDD